MPAEDLLAAGDVGLIPWVPLTEYDGPAETLLEQALDDLTLAYQQLRVLPELLTLVLHPKGQSHHRQT